MDQIRQSKDEIRFQIKIGKYTYACNIIFANEYQQDINKNKDVISTKDLSEKYPDYFIIVYGSDLCESISIPGSLTTNMYYKDAVAWYLLKQVFPTAGISKKDNDKILQCVTSSLGCEDQIYKFAKDHNIQIPKSLPGLLLFTELEQTNLDIWAREKHTYVQWKYVILSVLKCLLILQFEKKDHNMLIFENIVITTDNRVKIKNFTYVSSQYIIDPKIEKLQYNEHITDLDRFLSESWKEEYKINSSVLRLVRELENMFRDDKKWSLDMDTLNKFIRIVADL